MKWAWKAIAICGLQMMTKMMMVNLNPGQHWQVELFFSVKVDVKIHCFILNTMYQ